MPMMVKIVVDSWQEIDIMIDLGLRLERARVLLFSLGSTSRFLPSRRMSSCSAIYGTDGLSRNIQAC